MAVQGGSGAGRYGKSGRELAMAQLHRYLGGATDGKPASEARAAGPYKRAMRAADSLYERDTAAARVKYKRAMATPLAVFAAASKQAKTMLRRATDEASATLGRAISFGGEARTKAEASLARKAFMRAMEAATREYEQALARARHDLSRSSVAALTEFHAITAPARAEHERAMARARAAYIHSTGQYPPGEDGCGPEDYMP